MPAGPRMTGEGRKARLKAPPHSCETHSHVYGPQYPLAPGEGRNPHAEASVEAYERMLARLGVERGVIVQPSAYGTDNRATLDAIAAMGVHRARGVIMTSPDVGKAELMKLHDAGGRGMRFFLFPGGDLGLDVIDDVSAKVADLGWHVQVQGHGEEMAEWAPILKRLPCDSVIDHIGRVPVEGGVDNPAFRALLDVVETGKVWVKLSAPYHTSKSDPPLYDDLTDRVGALVAARPDRMVWAANWPHPHFPMDQKPDDADCLDVMAHWVPDEATRNAILADNPAKLYGFD
ncbi:MAG: amidohydrolase family protein [Acetobacterales bacterium]